jgi:hypothetical protein
VAEAGARDKVAELDAVGMYAQASGPIDDLIP